jgi:hypothetical protein
MPGRGRPTVGERAPNDLARAIAENTAAQTEPCPICGRVESHWHTREEWWAWEADR